MFNSNEFMDARDAYLSFKVSGLTQKQIDSINWFDAIGGLDKIKISTEQTVPDQDVCRDYNSHRRCDSYRRKKAMYKKKRRMRDKNNENGVMETQDSDTV